MSTNPKIRRQFIHGVPYWVVRIGKKLSGGAPQKKYFDTRTKAQDYVKKLIEISSELGSAKFKFMLSHGDEVMRAYQRLSTVGATFTEVVDFFIDRVAPGKASKTIQAVADEYIQALSAKAEKLFKESGDDRKLAYAANEKSRAKGICADYGSLLLHEILEVEIEDWILELDLGDKTKKHYLQTWKNIYRFAKRKRYCRDNPAEQVVLELENESDAPEILTPEEARKLLRITVEKDPRLIATVAIGLFAGLRRAEIFRLDTKYVDLKTGYIEVRAHTAKTGAKRFVPILPPLGEWLTLAQLPAGRVVPFACVDSLGERLSELAEAAGIEIPNNGQRHSFGSYRLAKTRDAKETSEIMGNSVAVLKKNYAKPVLPETAEAYFASTPDVVKAGSAQNPSPA